jgi:TRAP-type mannitol/chloroaromatic compound transport system substrate-binding protein
MADLRKMKVRSTGIRAAVLHEVGVSTVSLPGGELVPALQKGVVDAVEYSSLWWDWPMGFSDVTKYIYFSKAPMVGVLYGFINKDRWNELPSDLKKAVERAGFDSCLWCAIRTQYEDTKFAHNIGETTNVPVLWLPEDIEDELAAATLRLFEKRSKKDPKVKQVLDSWHKFYIDDNWLYYRQFLNPCQ